MCYSNIYIYTHNNNLLGSEIRKYCQNIDFKARKETLKSAKRGEMKNKNTWGSYTLNAITVKSLIVHTDI